MRVFSNRERAAADAIAAAGFEAFCPMYRTRVRYSDRWKELNRLLFPSYLFASAAPEFLATIANASGVVALLPSNLAPVAVRPDEIAAVRRAVESGLSLAPDVPTRGEPVEVMSGVLAGLRGVVVRSRAGGLRLVVTVHSFSSAMSIELDTSDVRRVNR